MASRDPMAWLSSKECPPIRHLAARDLAGRPSSPRALEAMRREALGWAPLIRILRLQQEDGGFPSDWKGANSLLTYRWLRVKRLFGR